LILCPATEEVEETVPMTTTTRAGIQQQSMMSNETTQEKCTWETHNKNSNKECNSTSMMKSKNLSDLVKNLIHTPSTLQPNSNDTNPSPDNQH